MKYCPNCENIYADDTLQYCLQDGSPLTDESNKNSDIPMVTLQEQETVVSSRQPDQVKFDLNDPPERIEREERQSVSTPVIQPEPKKSNNLSLILATALLTLLVFGLAGIGAYFYLNKNNKNSELVKDANSATNKNSSESIKKPAENLASETPEIEDTLEKTPTPDEPEETPTPEVDLGEIKNDISDRISSWKSQTESQDLDDYMNGYADRVDYYTKRGVSKNFVRNDKQRAFSKYDSVKFDISNIRISPSSDGRTANVVFDKEWNFSGVEDNSSGKVQQQLKLKKQGGNWLITSEKDLKVYYVSR
ncbi:MAG: L,D-transpeptidase Cds6 family protein [Aridibacter sp.]